MSTETLRFNEAGLGKWTGEKTFVVEAERLRVYAAATNDPIAAHVAGDVAGPVFAIVPVFDALLEPALDVVPLSVLGRVLHGEQDFRFHRPIRPGETLTSRARMTGFEGRPNGTRACVYLETRDAGGELVNEQYVTFFIRGFDDGRALGDLSPAHPFDDALRDAAPVADVTQRIDEDQTFRYAPASGDPMPIHLDEQVAKDSGLPGIIAHGFCVLAFTSHAILEQLGGSETARLKRLAVRFAKPVLPGQEIRTRMYAAGRDADGAATYAFETTVDGVPVLRDGLAVLAD
ncbi:MaoC family dehydratase N-terminal domain-containing protein [Paraconexibacter antarcticus]|uniref:MaoC family dehydratase N-terminal domain-containing protein n=1 Tax=Paraconexibacter antarcticus TaxID=2949664 RepID=A0ABY5DR16_9ACTN|nr:MaoC/PaaZ C-terminal domain-containing protein [Paraconexibacter antarcticus]UTI63688.1 MaoC family dehydratase N-terminal domain-containing protein [Paraconexibacter antarcticus]